MNPPKRIKHKKTGAVYVLVEKKAGFLGLRSWNDSDGAADLMANAQQSLVKVLRRGLKERGNTYNTDGATNVLLVMEGLLSPADLDDELHSVFKEAVAKLNGTIEKLKASKEEDQVSFAKELEQMMKRITKRLKIS